MFKLITAPASITESSVALIWERVGNGEYTIYQNGNRLTETSTSAYTVSGLFADSEYEFYISCGGERSNSVTVKTLPIPQIFNITDYGARSGELCTCSIQAAIDACCEGGVVVIPEGTFISGALFLKSDMTLEVNGTLLGSDNPSDYPVFSYRFEGYEAPCYASLINTADGAHRNITIRGNGCINANGKALKPKETEAKFGRAICIRSTDGVYLKDITVRQAPFWCIEPIYCRGISLDNIKLHTKYDENGELYAMCNCDGFDPDSCRDVYVFNSLLSSQDDCIALKSGRDREGREVGIPTENVLITDCVFKSGFGVACGSEMSGGVRNVLVRDCVFDNVYSIGSVKAPRGRGGVIENVRYERCVLKNLSTEHYDCEWFRGGIYVDYFYSHKEFNPDEILPVDDSTPAIRNITFEDIELETVAGNAIFICGLGESPAENITLKNVRAKGKFGLKAFNVNGLKLDNVSVTAENGEDIELVNCN